LLQMCEQCSKFDELLVTQVVSLSYFLNHIPRINIR
jgi:hypothetical protein